jgi:uncharacterized protein (TIGR02145 family)
MILIPKNTPSFFSFSGLILIFSLLLLQSNAQPQKVNYQAVALTAGGQTVKNQAIKLRLSIVDSSATGTVLYTETHQPTTDGAGQFSVFVGGGTATLGTFSSISWSNGKDKFLKAEADVTGGTNYVLMGSSQIVSVPYAIAAGSLKEGATITGANGSQYTLTVGANGPTWNLTNPNVNFSCGQAVTYAGESYPTVQIGTQCWFQKNLNVGSMILGANNQTNNGILEKYCYNNDTANCSIYGGLYQWAEAVQYQNSASNTTSPNPAFMGNAKGICPSGWHVPSDAEWCILTTFLDSTVDCSVNGNFTGIVVGGKMKSTSGLWNSPNTGANNSSSFSGLPSGYRFSGGGTFYDLHLSNYFWAASDFSNSIAITRDLNYNFSGNRRDRLNKFFGFSVRCLKD